MKNEKKGLILIVYPWLLYLIKDDPEKWRTDIHELFL